MKIPILKIPYTKGERDNIKNGIDKIINSGFFTMGKKVKEFEDKFAKFVGTKYAIAVNSGTSALEIIFRSLNIEDKDIIIPTNTFMATPLAAIHAGAKVKFCDINLKDLSIDYDDLKKKITKNTKAIVLVHIAGIISKDYKRIKDLAFKKNIFLIEDAAHAHGSKFKNKFAGNLGIAGAFSFYPTKIVNAAEGGIITTNNYKIYKTALILREHGKTNKFVNNHSELGYNWRFSELHALLGLQQLNKLKSIISERNKIARYYDRKLKDSNNLTKLKLSKKNCCSYYKYVIFVDKEKKNKIKKLMKNKFNIILPGEVYDYMCHEQPVFKKYKNKIINFKENLNNSNTLRKVQLCLPLYRGLKEKNLNYIINSLNKTIEILEK